MSTQEAEMEDEVCLRVADRQTVAGSRDLGFLVRQDIERALAEGRHVALDLADVQSMSPSFADEVFGKLSEQMEDDARLSSKLSIHGIERFEGLINAVIKTRLNRLRKRAAR